MTDDDHLSFPNRRPTDPSYRSVQVAVKRCYRMLNKKPIFIVGLARGGSSILLNALRSHPIVCSPRGETQEVFIGKKAERYEVRFAKLRAYLPIVLRQREHVFSTKNLKKRKPLSPSCKTQIDRILYRDKMLATGETQNRYKSSGVEYTSQEIRESRLLCKNLGGLAFTTAIFMDMYPDAKFFGLVRNGLAVCEGVMRRGMSPQKCGQLYAQVCTQIANDSDRFPAFHLIHYEALAEKTVTTALEVFESAGLDPSLVKMFRLVVDNDGQRSGGGAEILKWYSKSEFEQVVSGDFDTRQIERLPGRARDAFLREAGGVMERLGYI